MSNTTYCIIGKLKLVPVDGSKTLQLGYFGGLSYAVSKDFVEDKLYCIFLPDGQLSKAYFDANKEHLSFFGKNRKVRSIKLMQGKITSVGYVADIESLAFTGYDLSQLKEGDNFNELNGVKICNKFVTEFTKAQSIKNRKVTQSIKETIALKIRPDVEQFYKFCKDIPKGSIISITGKLDGTQLRVANSQVSVKKWYHKLLSFIPFKDKEYTHINGTHRTIITESKIGYYQDNKIYTEFGDRLKGLLYPNESVYIEVVGWIDEQRPLFNRGGMIFKYGCNPGERDCYAFEIRWTLDNGQQIILNQEQTKQRCIELGLKYVPELVGPFVYDGNIRDLQDLVYSLTDGPDFIDNSHIREGVVIRVENGFDVKFYKSKSAQFYALESTFKEDGNVDLEEVNTELP